MGTLEDTAAIVTWQRTTLPGVRRKLLDALFRAKHGLVRTLTLKAARKEKSTVDDDELMQAGFIGFQRALEGFDATRGFAISTYAWGWIRHEVQSVTRAEKLISLPRIRLTNDEREMVRAALEDDPELDPSSIGIPRTQFEQIKASFGLRFVSDSVPSGAIALEQCMHERASHFDMEADIDRRREERFVAEQVALVRGGVDVDGTDLTAEEYDHVKEYICTKEKEGHHG